MGSIGPQEILVILLIALIVVGPQRLPELARSIGKGLSEFRKVQEEVKGMVKLDLDDKPERPAAGTPTAPGAHRTPRPASPLPAAEAEPPGEPPGEGPAAAPDDVATDPDPTQAE